MTDLRELLDTAAGEPASPGPDVVGSDLRRGRTALRRRRGLRAAAGLVLAGVALVGGMVVVPGLGDPTEPTIVVPGGSSSVSGVRLVPWDAGATPKPFSPNVVPEGWTISANQYALVISPPDLTTPRGDFEGKLVAMLVKHPHPPARAQPVRVTYANAEGTTWREGNTTIFLLRVPNDPLTLEVRAPESLGWNLDTLVAFANSVETTSDAKPSTG
jgi:hypothetical protein